MARVPLPKMVVLLLITPRMSDIPELPSANEMREQAALVSAALPEGAPMATAMSAIANNAEAFAQLVSDLDAGDVPDAMDERVARIQEVLGPAFGIFSEMLRPMLNGMSIADLAEANEDDVDKAAAGLPEGADDPRLQEMTQGVMAQFAEGLIPPAEQAPSPPPPPDRYRF